MDDKKYISGERALKSFMLAAFLHCALVWVIAAIGMRLFGFGAAETFSAISGMIIGAFTYYHVLRKMIL